MRDRLADHIVQLYDGMAPRYETEPGHAIAAAEHPAWIAFLKAVIAVGPDSRVLDVGAGTGVFSRILAAAGAEVTALEPSASMIEQGRARDRADDGTAWVWGDTHDDGLFEAGEFDLIVSRQAVCYLHDPILAFANWYRWLVPGGRALVIDGLWSRDDWGHTPLIDELPLSCLQTRATLPYLLKQVGFAVEAADMSTLVGDTASGVASPIYGVVATKHLI